MGCLEVRLLMINVNYLFSCRPRTQMFLFPTVEPCTDLLKLDHWSGAWFFWVDFFFHQPYSEGCTSSSDEGNPPIFWDNLKWKKFDTLFIRFWRIYILPYHCPIFSKIDNFFLVEYIAYLIFAGISIVQRLKIYFFRVDWEKCRSTSL